MPGFVLKDLLLISLLEKKARRESFHPQITLIKGENDVGKSSFIKSIYRCFGANSPQIHPKWKGAKVIGIVSFEVNDKRYRILEETPRYTVFDGNDDVLHVFDSVTIGLGPFLAKLLGFELTLMSRDGKVVTPPSAYLFLPFYIDQDAGWTKPWNSFANLGQFPDWKKSLAEYYTGIRPNDFYKAKGEAEAFQEELKPVLEREAVLQGVLKDLNERLKLAEFSIDIDRYREEIRELLVVCDGLSKREEESKKELVALYNQKTLVEAQITIGKEALGELSADFDFSSKELPEDHVECPLCNAPYSNSFTERFAIAADEDRCYELLGELSTELDGVNDKLKSVNDKYVGASSERAQIQEILSRKQGEIQLKDLIESEGRREVQVILKADIAKVTERIKKLQGEIDRLKKDMDLYTDKERKKEVTTRFRELMKKFLFDLEVHTLSVDKMEVQSTVKETGSDMPRALLAYYFSIIYLLKTYAASTFCPLVIDSPNQQDQDLANLKKMLQFINNNRPFGSQCILGLVDDCGVDFGGRVLHLTEKYSVLQSENYEELSTEAKGLMRKSMAWSEAQGGDE